VHAEVCSNLHGIVDSIKELGIRAGASINPGTPVDIIDSILPQLDLVLVMSVNPGYAGQSFIEDAVEKIARVRETIDEMKLTAELEVDGGITAETAPKVVAAGAQVLVAGSAIFNNKDSVAEAVNGLRASFGNK
jgi:ribulose-phosphate 3-epimerase